MRVFKTQKDNSVYINLISIFFIFVTFIGLAFIILIMELNFYNRTKDSVDDTFNKGTIISYLNNKIRNYDGEKIEIVRDKEYKDSDVLILEDSEQNLKTYIYVMDGYMMEDVSGIKDKFIYGNGQKLFEINQLRIEKDKNLIQFEMKTNKKDKINSYVYTR